MLMESQSQNVHPHTPGGDDEEPTLPSSANDYSTLQPVAQEEEQNKENANCNEEGGEDSTSNMAESRKSHKSKGRRNPAQKEKKIIQTMKAYFPGL